MDYTYVYLVVEGKVSTAIRALVDTISAYVVLAPRIVSDVRLHEMPFEAEMF